MKTRRSSAMELKISYTYVAKGDLKITVPDDVAAGDLNRVAETAIRKNGNYGKGMLSFSWDASNGTFGGRTYILGGAT
jgi:hypothetical protein